ncbi:hypothetical protein P879_03735 [Paragonimus westermani]|uniref:Potassium channel domain-containing protein n=1 Tax=Paragonimus westermani TaxID=34504 RepID=A0A8T0D7H5_9TREM|nr:hypothetical protein P879_03735 [Paragonimus westermani]
MNLNGLVQPLTRWVHQITQGLIFPAEPLIIQNKAAVGEHIRSNNIPDSIPLAAGGIPILLQNLNASELADPKGLVQIGTHTTAARIEDGQYMSRETLFSTNFRGKINQQAMLGQGPDSTFTSTMQSQFALEPTSVTMTLPPGSGTDVKRIPSQQTRYFTFDGQHRKFYLAARYLRSAQRQRRHKRRIAQKVKEQARSEYNRLQNALSYGNLNGGYKRREKRHVLESPPDRTLETLSLDSEVTNETGIPLICWKDIDLELEVRSIDDETELARLGYVDSHKNMPTATSTQITRMERVKVVKHTGQPDNRPRSRNASVKKQDMTECKNGTGSVLKWMRNNAWSNNTDDVLIPKRPSAAHKCRKIVPSQVTSADANHGKDSERNALQENDMNFPSKIDFPNVKQTDIQTPFSLPGDGRELGRKVMSSITKQPQVEASVPKLISNNILYHNKDREPQISINSHHLTLGATTSSNLPFPPLKSSRSFQTEHLKSLVHSTVIPNPLAIETLKDESVEKALGQGKSRLSIVSSRGDLSSDVNVQLSYYSQQESARTEEDLSLFTFGEGFSAEEDISKVTVPISLSLLIMATYILIGSIVFSIWEDKDYLKWSYFCFITLSTIGFGDIVPGTKIDSENTKEKMVIISLYVAIGLSVFAMCFKLMQEEVVDKVKWFANKVGILKGKQKKRHEKSL